MTSYPRRNTAPSYEEEFDRDAEEQSEARVINVSPFTARFEVATVPGSKPRRYALKPGESVHLQFGYTTEFMGAGRQPVRPTIESLTEREVRSGSRVRLPMVVHESKAREVSDAWRQALAQADAPPAPVKVMLPSANGGEPVEMTVHPSAPAPARVPRGVVIEDEDQDGPLDEPPPDHDEPDEVTLPSAPASATAPMPTDGKGGKGAKGSGK